MTMAKKRPRLRLAVDTLVVDTFPAAPEIEIPQLGMRSASACTWCPTQYESGCPCCTGPQLCG
ncbi:hypothetical protein [Longimicrobium sp.]|uniref:hypothetical protein n=1 Tax=Longimicrobium sp. TaxID=2029185 RepID=UPI002BC9D4D9|nr:hypothetical protein [Longimicrobium sp.]HSU15011.1 hypothetical protein [Longimicrobium sp.]